MRKADSSEAARRQHPDGALLVVFFDETDQAVNWKNCKRGKSGVQSDFFDRRRDLQPIIRGTLILFVRNTV